jgi:hypothetical protein
MTPDPFELIDSPFAEGKMERWRAEAMAGGAMGMLQNVYDIVRSDTAATAARANALENREQNIARLCEVFTNFADHVVRLVEAEEQRQADARRRADEAAARAAEEASEEPIELPPGDPTVEDADIHEPTGDLHTIAAKTVEPPGTPANDEADLPSELPEPPLETEDDAEGVPLSYGKVPTSYVHAEDQVEFAIPEPGMTTDARRKPRGSVLQQPAAISLNED